jgi:hypothetical protein
MIVQDGSATRRPSYPIKTPARALVEIDVVHALKVSQREGRAGPSIETQRDMWLLIAREQERFVKGHVPGRIVRFSIKDTPALREYFNIHEQLPPTQRGTKPKLILRASSAHLKD